MRRSDGFSLVEVIVAIAILGVVLAATALTVLSSLRQNASAGERTQAALLMNYFGRRIAGGEAAALGAAAWDYGELEAGFADLTGEDGFADPDAYRVDLSIGDEIAIGGTSMRQFRIEVCWRVGGEESCAVGDTVGPPLGVDTPEALPGIN